jgi:hypothetical protein
MDLKAITLARATILFEIEAIDPHGQANTMEAFKTLSEKFSFAEFPKTFEEIDFKKGIELAFGKMGDINIDRLVLFEHGIVVDTRSSTEDSEKVIMGLIDFAREAFGAKVAFNRQIFVSQFIFQSKVRLLTLHPALQEIADQVAASVSRDLKQTFSFEPSGVILRSDWTTRVMPGHFSIERRAEVPYAEDTYFASAPLRTNEHLDLVQRFEHLLGSTNQP